MKDLFHIFQSLWEAGTVNGDLGPFLLWWPCSEVERGFHTQTKLGSSPRLSIFYREAFGQDILGKGGACIKIRQIYQKDSNNIDCFPTLTKTYLFIISIFCE